MTAVIKPRPMVGVSMDSVNKDLPKGSIIINMQDWPMEDIERIIAEGMEAMAERYGPQYLLAKTDELLETYAVEIN